MQGTDIRIRLTPIRALALAILTAGLSGVAVQPGWCDEEGPAVVSQSVVVVPFTISGRVDETLTSTFVGKLSENKVGLHVAESSSVAKRLPKGKRFSSARDMKTLLKAARAAGVDSVVVGRASRYKRLGAAGVKLKISLVDAKSGETLHEELSKETSWTAKGAKEEAAESAAKSLVKGLSGK